RVQAERGCRWAAWRGGAAAVGIRQAEHRGGRLMGANGSGVTRLFTSESVSEGHPDKVCDFIADSVLDAFLDADRNSRVACEALCKSNHVVVAGEITSAAHVDVERVVRGAIRTIGYDDPAEPFNAAAAFFSL